MAVGYDRPGMPAANLRSQPCERPRRQAI